MTEADIVSINNLKILAIDMQRNANVEDSTIALSTLPIIYDLYSRHLLINPEDPTWLNRDRFIISASHTSSLIYSVLHFAGLPITVENLQNYGRIKSNTPELLEYGITPGIETTGILGSAVANAVGHALVRRYLNALTKIENSKIDLIDYHTYLLVSKNDLITGIANESLAFAGCQQLNNLIVLYDNNDINKDNIFTEDVLKKYTALGFECYLIKDSYNLKELDKVLERAKKSLKPVLIEVQTNIKNIIVPEEQNIISGIRMSDNDYLNLKNKLNIKTNPFEISKEAILHLRNQMSLRIVNVYNNWLSYKNEIVNSGNTYLIDVINAMNNGYPVIDYNSNSYKISETYREAIIASNKQVMELIINKSPLFLMSNAVSLPIMPKDLNTKDNPLGKNIDFNSREMAMSGIMNGIAMNGIRISGNTSLTLSDNMKSQIRLSALMNLPVTYILTEDSIKIGSLGPVYQPIEQLLGLRSISNLNVYRPCDVEEIMGCWENILKSKRPSALILSKEIVTKESSSNASLVSKGAYIIRKENGPLDAIIISTGDNVIDAIRISNSLENRGKNIRVVSMPCQELFLETDLEYQNIILPRNIKTIVIEPSSPLSWDYFTERKNIISINEFGCSGTKEEVLTKFNYTYESLLIRVVDLLK